MAELTLQVIAGGADARELDRLTTSLFTDLRRAGGVNVARAAAETPAGGKSGAGLQIAELVITGTLSASTVAVVGKVVTAFVGRAKDRSVKITRDGETWEFTGISADDQRRLAELAGPDGADRPAGDDQTER